MTNNDTFKQLLHLTGLKSDQETLIELYAEHGISLTKSNIKSWITNPDDRRFRVIPDDILNEMFQILFAVRDEALQKDMNLFDLRNILKDIRSPN